MGYTLYIDRPALNGNGARVPIAVEEWLALMSDDRELEPVETVESRNPRTGERIELSIPNSASWVDPDGGRSYYFVYAKGRIRVDNPPDSAISKMKVLAESLKAQVIGDEGEKY